VFRPYDPARDNLACRRIWRECGWVEPEKEELVDLYANCCRARVAELQGEAECLVLTADGTMRYLDEELPISCVTGVTTSRIARKQGIAGRLLARAVAEDAAAGALVSGLFMFEQGFYNRLGYGSGPYEFRMSFDPAHLILDRKPRVPRRLSADDWKDIHASLLARARGHGALNLLESAITRAELQADKDGFGLGYRDEDNRELTHHFWCSCDNVEGGPYRIKWMSFRTGDQFLELMAVIKTLADQVRLVTTNEPAGIQLQDLIREPMRHRGITEGSEFASKMEALADYQARICDLPGCLSRTHLDAAPIRFNLVLRDPIVDLLAPETPWRGVGGHYVVQLGQDSFAELGNDASFPELNSSAGAFTRLWLGVRPATGLAITDDLSGPDELLRQLDRTLRVPPPRADWDF